MEAATKNRRGRPKNELYHEARITNNLYGAYNVEIGTRALQNTVNAQYFLVNGLDDDSEALLFFLTNEGNLKHKGIAEQIGRLMMEHLITNKDAEKIAETAIQHYNNGQSSKQIETMLRHYRNSLKEAATKKEKKGGA